jgi:sigma-B regulation protein RsbU (phosphoserine phosphatase)
MLLAEARETGELREQFIAVLGHDLRNPLAAIASGASLLVREPLSERGMRILGMVQGSVVRMSELIDNILDFARGRLGGGITLDRNDDVLLEPLLQQVVAELRIGVPGADIEIEIDVMQPINCDRSRIGQLVSNLIGNALTHGAPDEPVRVIAEIDNDVLKLSICNGGKEISGAAMERLFQPFFRGEVRPSQQGLGLGLHIASTIAAAHGGTLTAISTDKETRFIFQMPLLGALRAETHQGP